MSRVTLVFNSAELKFKYYKYRTDHYFHDTFFSNFNFTAGRKLPEMMHERTMTVVLF